MLTSVEEQGLKNINDTPSDFYQLYKNIFEKLDVDFVPLRNAYHLSGTNIDLNGRSN